MSTFDRFLNNTIKVLLVSLICIMLIIGLLFASPVYATDVDNLSNLGITYVLNNNSSVSGNDFTIKNGSTTPLVIKFTQNGQYVVNFSFTCDTSPNYMLNVWNGGNSANSFSDVTNGTISANGNGVSFGQGSCSLVINVTTASTDSPTGALQFSVQKQDGSTASSYTGYVTSFAILGENESVSSPSFERTITIRPGYVAYIETDGGTLDLIANFHEFSRFSQPLWDNGVRISFDGGLVPTSGTIFNNSFGSSIAWLKPAFAPTNLLGQTMVGGKSFTAGLPEGGSNKCVVIYNPAYANADTIIGGGTPTIGPTLTARFSNLVSVNQYALQGDVTRTFEDGIIVDSGSPNGYDEGYMYIPSENDPSSVVGDTDYYQFNLADNTSSPAITITAGGYNATVDYGVSTAPEDADNGIVGLLSRILKFLATPITHIMDLFTAGGNLMTWLGQLWSWLPTDVGLVIVDALIVLVVIGAIKFLWK